MSGRRHESVRGRGRGDSGALLAELALALPLLLILLLGTFEFGYAWQKKQGIASAARNSVRAGVQAQDNSQADLVALQSLLAGVSKLEGVTLERVVIFWVNQPSNPNANVPAACLATPPPTSSGGLGVNTSSVKCNIYPANRLTSAALVSANFGCNSGDYDRAWCPTAREKSLGASGGPTWVGIYVETSYKTMTNILPGSGTIILKDKAVSRVEPTVT